MKQKKISKEEYVKLFCPDKRIRERMVIYVSREIHRKIKIVAYLFRKQHVTSSSLADAILSHHISIHKDLLNEIQEEDAKNFEELLYNLNKRNTASDDEENEDEIENTPD